MRTPNCTGVYDNGTRQWYAIGYSTGVNDMVAIRPRSKGKGKRSIPPSRVKYEQGHPTVTIRVSRELHNDLKYLKDYAGTSLGDILRVGLEMAKPATDAAYQQGYDMGYSTAKITYEVTYRCSHCHRRHMSITGNKAMEAAATLMQQAGWHSTACPRRDEVPDP